MKTIKKVLFASVLLASLGATSGVVMAAQKFEPFTDGAGSRPQPRDPFTDGGRSATGQADTEHSPPVDESQTHSPMAHVR
ncbi:hypothetical protein [Cupriavidus basilensis]